jgi:heat shock protein HspQ
MMNEELYHPNDFIIRVEPVFSEDDEWTSEVEVNICYSEDNTLDEDDFETLFTLTHLICSSVPFFANHPEIMSLAKSYLDKEQAKKKDGTSIDSIMNKRFNGDNVVKGNFTKAGNIVHIDFKNRED